jgi:prepilin-type processing-associated H-X9-DG protein
MSEIKVNSVVNSTGDNDSGLDLSTNDKIGIKIANAEVATVDTTGVVFNDASADRDFRVESNGNANMLFVDGGNDKVGIGVVPTARLSLPAQASGDSGVARVAIESAVDSNDFTIAQYEDTNGTYTQIGQNVSLNSGGSTTVLDSSHKTASILFDGRGNGALMFQTGGDNTSAEAMRIDSSGRALIGTTSAIASAGGAKFQLSQSNNNWVHYIENSASSGGIYGVYLRFSGSSPDDNNSVFMIGQDSGGTIRFYIYSDGDIKNHDNSYSAISDEKLKEQITDASSQWEDIKALRVRKYKMKEDVAVKGDSDEHWRLGVIAQELETAGMNGLVKDDPDLVEDENGQLVAGDTTTKSVKYSILYMKAVKALQEAMTRIETLEAKVTALENAE